MGVEGWRYKMLFLYLDGYRDELSENNEPEASPFKKCRGAYRDITKITIIMEKEFYILISL